MIVLQRLRWDNCFSYGKNNVIDFSKNILTQLLGKNGHGKSSIALILQEVLYSKNTKGIKKADILNRETSDKYYVIELDLEVDGIQYKITQRRTSNKLDVILLRGTEDISDHTATSTLKKIQEILGLTFEEFTQLIYQSNDSTLNLLKATDVSRKKFLVSLLNLQRYTELGEIVKQVLHSVLLEKTETTAAIETVRNWLNKADSVALEPKKLEEVPEEPEGLKEEIANLKAAKNVTTASKTAYKRAKENNDRIESVISLPEVEKPDTPIVSLKEEIATKKTILQGLAKKKKELESIEDTCPTCKRPFDDVSPKVIQDSIQEIIKEAVPIKNEITDLTNTLSQVEALWSKYNAYQAKVESIRGLKIQELPEIVEFSERVLQDKVNQLETITKEIARVTKYNSEVLKHNSKLETMRETKAGYESQLEELNNKLQPIVDREARLKILKQVFGPSGLVAYKIESLVEELEGLINHYVTDLSNGRFTVFFQMDKDKLNLSLTDHGKEIEAVALSAGELARVNTGILLAIRKLLSSLSKNKVNLLIFDDVIGILDDEAREKLVEILGQEDMNTFIVSQSWSHPLLARIIIEKEDKISTLRED